ncbi:hypothetical protein ANAPC5_00887 [Anaplasma phagocytophilum]|nr:hypothetical protein ANAPC3_00580 [Anaplasma phagocytophilum]SBO31586.1 hypothetical protein ANAPC2_00709 [Anaplasma phagocytophilum]SBO32972.1 hypothetical protein ANAPC4_00990 [Anaplasma phagocytophilum]SCV64512.1 hypothetical protein ANAPC5_00887 [Anaplasma phagocytophilum]
MYPNCVLVSEHNRLSGLTLPCIKQVVRIDHNTFPTQNIAYIPHGTIDNNLSKIISPHNKLLL